jgi:ABC-2 type transport system permease protein
VVWHALTASPILVVAALAFPIQAPASWAAGLAYAASLLLSILLSFLIGCLLAVTAFWTLELRGFNWLAGLLITFLSGGYVPLWLLPPFFQSLSNFLPFQSLLYLPLAIYIGKIEGPAVWPALGQQVLWLAILSLALAGYWKITERKIVVQGG